MKITCWKRLKNGKLCPPKRWLPVTNHGKILASLAGIEK
jgi:hypothetical protein